MTQGTSADPQAGAAVRQGPNPKTQRKTVAVLLVPFTGGSQLQKCVQQAEDKFVEVVGGARVRVLEKGGNKLAGLLCRYDPWAAKRTCADKDCVTCESNVWLNIQKKSARKSGTPLPDAMVKSTTNLYRREGCNYVAQCMDCMLAGKDARYEGESSRSPRQRQG